MLTISEWRGPTPALTTEQMRAVDRAMIEDYGITLLQMMENAGRHLATLARAMLGGAVEGKFIVVLAGRGNNGGGGMVAARRLANWGANLRVLLSAAPEKYRDDASARCRDQARFESQTPRDAASVPAQQLAILQKMGVPVMVGTQRRASRGVDLILDALIGYGLRGAPRGVTADLIRAANRNGAKVIALDAPSGLDTTTGEIFDPCIHASATLTLALPKIGLLEKGARDLIGDLYIADISVPPRVYAAMGIELPNIFAEAEIVQVKETKE